MRSCAQPLAVKLVFVGGRAYLPEIVSLESNNESQIIALNGPRCTSFRCHPVRAPPTLSEHAPAPARPLTSLNRPAPKNEKRKINACQMSSYLLAFCIGEFDYVQGSTKEGRVGVRVYTPPGKSHLGTFALEVAEKTLDLYDAFFQERYPLPKLDMVAIPEFAMGAMENWGLVTYREVDLLIDEVGWVGLG